MGYEEKAVCLKVTMRRTTKEIAEIMKYAKELIDSLPYKVSARKIFYKLVQYRGLQKKDYTNFKAYTSDYRKNFKDGWHPNIMHDGVRQFYPRGFPKDAQPAEPDRIIDRPCYSELWFESVGMIDQFFYYTKDYHISLLPFMGDLSIPMKWETAERLEKVHETYGKHIKILYFGDCDDKGKKIPHSALSDIRAWCKVGFEVVHIGLTLEQAMAYKIPKNVTKPGAYQWEGLTDAQAKEIILSGLKMIKWSKRG